MLTHETILNLFSNPRLNDSTKDFLELIKFNAYDMISNEKFEIINHVNSDIHLLRKIFDFNLDLGFTEIEDLSYSDKNSPLYDSFLEINRKRKSIRKYSREKISYQEFSDFLKIFYSVTGVDEINFNGEILNRKIKNIASGGSLYPTEIYIVNTSIEDIKKGLYYYNVNQTKLELIKEFQQESDYTNFFKLIMHDDNRKSTIDFEHTSCFMIFTSVLNKLTSKYQDFGVALALIEIGQFVHSAYLSAATMDLACCPFGGMLNDKMRDFLEINNHLHTPIICMSLGKK